MNFIERLKDPRPVVLDGAMGTMLMEKLPGFTGCVERINLERPDLVKAVHSAYIESGAEIISTNTFGGNDIKLSQFRLESSARDIIVRSVEAARQAAAGKHVYVAGCMGPTGKLIEPLGDTRVSEVYGSFRSQASILAESGVDLFLVETMSDLLEAKTALRAIREVSTLPVVCNLTFDPGGRTVSGTDMLTGLSTLSQIGADVVGANCSMGPEGLLELFRSHITDLRDLGTPLSVWANAGLPEFRAGRAVYTLSPERFGEISVHFAELGVKIIGGCCGTTPAHIGALRDRLGTVSPPRPVYGKKFHYITGRFSSLNIAAHKGLLVIGERLNPTARKKFAEDLKNGGTGFIREESRRQESEGAHLLDINVGVPSIDERNAMRESVKILTTLVRTPLMIDSDNPDVVSAALEVYPGIPIINSVNGKGKSAAGIIPLVKHFGAFIVALCLDESGIHKVAEKRIAIGENLLDMLGKAGISSERVFIDPLMLAESAEPGSAMETLKVIQHFAGNGIKTSLGISNISFGLPSRKHVNTAFLHLARQKGLSAAIVNPSAIRDIDRFLPEEELAVNFLTGNDPGASKYIAHFQVPAASGEPRPQKGTADHGDILSVLFNMVVEGDSDGITGKVNEALKELAPETIMNEGLIRGLERVGELYNSGEYFLPQMIASANAMKTGFQVLKPVLSKNREHAAGKIVICTVHGDVHDIGKNIVALMMENHGFEVVDLGKDVPAERILQALREERPHILCLSSLLTTTMHQMKLMGDIIHEQGLPVKLMVGGAVVNNDYARSIGAYYAEDAVTGVSVAKRLLAEQ